MTDELIFLRKAQKESEDRIFNLCSAFAELQVHCKSVEAEMEMYWLEAPEQKGQFVGDEELLKFIAAKVSSGETNDDK